MVSPLQLKSLIWLWTFLAPWSIHFICITFSLSKSSTSWWHIWKVSLARSPSLRRFGDNQEAAHVECWDGKSEGSCTRLQWRPGVFSRQCISLTLFMSPTSADNSLKSSPPLPQNTIVTTSGKRNVAEESNQNQKKAKPKTPLTQVHQELSTFHFRIKCFWSSSYGWLKKNNPTPSYLENASKFLNKKRKYAQNKMSIPKKKN